MRKEIFNLIMLLTFSSIEEYTGVFGITLIVGTFNVPKFSFIFKLKLKKSLCNNFIKMKNCFEVNENFSVNKLIFF